MDPEGIGIVIGLFVLVVCIAVFCLFLLSLQKALTLCGREHRRMEPGLVWLNLVPLLNLGWIIFTVLKISEAIQAKYAAHDQIDPGEGGKAIGLAYAILVITSILPIIGFLTGIAAIVCWIIYWVKISNYNTEMLAMQA